MANVPDTLRIKPLTAKQRDALLMRANGCSYREIGGFLRVSKVAAFGLVTRAMLRARADTDMAGQMQVTGA